MTEAEQVEQAREALVALGREAFQALAQRVPVNPGDTMSVSLALDDETKAFMPELLKGLANEIGATVSYTSGASTFTLTARVPADVVPVDTPSLADLEEIILRLQAEVEAMRQKGPLDYAKTGASLVSAIIAILRFFHGG